MSASPRQGEVSDLRYVGESCLARAHAGLSGHGHELGPFRRTTCSASLESLVRCDWLGSASTILAHAAG